MIRNYRLRIRVKPGRLALLELSFRNIEELRAYISRTRASQFIPVQQIRELEAEAGEFYEMLNLLHQDTKGRAD